MKSVKRFIEYMFGINNLRSHETHVALTVVSLVPNINLVLWKLSEVWDWKLFCSGASIHHQYSLRKITSILKKLSL